MKILFECQFCGLRGRVDKAHEGKKARCKCGKVFVLKDVAQEQEKIVTDQHDNLKEKRSGLNKRVENRLLNPPNKRTGINRWTTTVTPSHVEEKKAENLEEQSEQLPLSKSESAGTITNPPREHTIVPGPRTVSAQPTTSPVSDVSHHRKPLLIPILVTLVAFVLIVAATIWFLYFRSNDIRYGKSFNVIKEVNGDSYVLSGYMGLVNGRQKVFSPHAVLVVGVAGGVTLGGQKFDQGTIVVVEGDESNPVYRIATPRDRIVLAKAVTVFDKSYPPGEFRVPASGRLPIQEESQETEVKAVPIKVVDGKMEVGDELSAKRRKTQEEKTGKKDGVSQWRGENVMDLSGSEVTCKFKGQKYEAKVSKGGLKFDDFGDVAMNGVISGKQVAVNEPSELWRSVNDSRTRCRILDHDGLQLLLDGDVEQMNNKSLLIAPGSVIENQTTKRDTIPIARPKDGEPYPLAYGETIEIDQNGEVVNKKGGAGAQKPARSTDRSKRGLLPPYAGKLTGKNPVRIRNPNEFSVTVAIRSGQSGKNFDVSAKGSSTVYIPEGRYDIYFIYSTNPDALFQGDTFAINNNGVEIQIVKVVNGNYNIREVK